MFGLALAVLTLTVLLFWSYLRKLPAPLPVYGEVKDFTLTNQSSAPVSLANLRGQVWVADVIFTRCPSSCPQMTKRMNELQAVLPANSPVKLISLTTDPDFDTPSVLKKYAEKYGAQSDRWWFLTGSRDQVGPVLTNSLRLVAVATRPEERSTEFDLFTHSTLFVIVDKHARLRGWAEATLPGWKQKVLDVTNQLLREGSE